MTVEGGEGVAMSTETPTRPTETTAPGRKPPLLWILALIAALVIGVVVGWLVLGDDGTEPTVDAEIEQEIAALIDDWYTAWNTGDGQLAVSLFTTDGRFVYYDTQLEGLSGEKLKAHIERMGGPASYSAVRIGSPLIIEWPNAYHVVQKWQPREGYSREYFELLNIVDEGGSLRFRYVEDWATLGWFQLAEGLPYRPVNEAG